MAGYVGNIPVPQATQTRQSFTATASQTSFPTIGYTEGFFDCHLNGVKLLAGVDFNVGGGNGSDVILATGAALNDILEVTIFDTFNTSSGTFSSTTLKNNVTLKNDTHEDSDGGRASKIIYQGEQSGGEISTLAEIQASHDGTADDQKSDLIFRTNDGSDGTSPTEAMRIDSAQNVGIGTASTDISGNGTSYVGLSVVETVGSRRGFIEIGDNQNADTGGIGDINFVGHYQNAGHKVMASVRGVADGSTSGQRGANVKILTKADASSTLSERVRIDSDGLKFNGDTAATNALSDYEEGTWTVNLTKGGSALPVNTRYGYYTKVGNLLYIQFYWFHNGGLSSDTNNGSQYKVEGMPYAIQAGTAAAYAGIGSTYLVVNNNNVANDYYHKWQVNATDKLSLTGHATTTAHTTGVLEFAGAGVFRT